jgi:hypothetical protein
MQCTPLRDCKKSVDLTFEEQFFHINLLWYLYNDTQSPQAIIRCGNLPRQFDLIDARLPEFWLVASYVLFYNSRFVRAQWH